MDLVIGNIVTVTLVDSIFHGTQGEVVEIKDDGDEDGNIGVMPGPDGERYLGYCRNDSERIVRYEESDLRLDNDWTAENRTHRLFGNNWHHVYTFSLPLDPEQDCMHKDCDNKRSARIMVNIWGTVCEFDVCDSHRDEWHGNCADEFPFKKP